MFPSHIPHEVKKRRLQEIVDAQQEVALQHNLKDIGKTFKVLIEGTSKKSEDDFKGRNSQNKVMIFPKMEGVQSGDYVNVKVHNCTSATLLGEIV